MRLTQRGQASAGLAAVLAACAVLFDRWLLLGGTIGIAAWLLGAQVAFLSTLVRLDRSLEVTQSVTPTRATTETTFEVELTATVETGSPARASLTPSFPVAATDETVREQGVLERGETTATTAVTVEFPVAGTYTIGVPDVHVEDPVGLFAETLPRGGETTVAVDPVGTSDLSIRRAGERATVASPGGRTSTRRGRGLESVSAREYVPGDPLDRIDWRATARLNAPHVREFELESNRQLVVVFDHRASMATGPAGRTKLDYAREFALGVLGRVAADSGAIGLYGVGDEGLTARYDAQAELSGYASIRSFLVDVEPTGRVDMPRPSVASTRHPPAPTSARYDTLAADESAFAAAVRPFLTAGDPYTQRVEDPLHAAISRAQRRHRGQLQFVLITDDERATQVQKATKLAASSDAVRVFLTPTVLYEPEALAVPEAAYERYRHFESFRRSLEQSPRAMAFEIAPGEQGERIRTPRDRDGTQPTPTDRQPDLNAGRGER